MASAQSIQISIKNDRTHDSDRLHLLLTADNVSGLSGIPLDTVSKLSDLKHGVIAFDTIKSARLYVGLGEFANPPTPDGPHYFGWIEFTKTAADTAVWVNLSNVDLTGLPLALSGTTSAGKAFSLGTRVPMTSPKGKKNLIEEAQAIPAGAGAFITTENGKGPVKILAPTVCPDAYPTFDSYLKSLCDAEAPLSLRSDVPPTGSAVTFSGSFLKAKKGSDVIVSLTSASNDTLTVTKDNLTSQIIYACDGGNLSYNGTSYPQNRTAANDPGSTESERVITNSIFRNLMIGLNEGYLSALGPNDSTQFPGQTPFAGGNGNLYARLVHQATNSYGFAYADANLKTLITADPTEVLTLTILKDDQILGYSSDPGGVVANLPQTGKYQFGIGSGSGALGPIRINNWCYPASDYGAFGGYLPDLKDWTKMAFSGLGPEHYIWVKNGKIHTGGCLSADPVWTNDVTEWPADLAWVSGKTAPAKPKPEPC